MAKLFEKSTFLFVFLGLLVLAKGHGPAGVRLNGLASGAATAAGGFGAGAGVAGAAGAANAVGGGLGRTNVHVRAGVDKGCACNDEVSDFFNRVALLLRYYVSKELGPELEALAVRFVEFFFSHLAATKPEVMTKLHGFVQSSAQVTGAAVAKIPRA